jgi:uncharacterized membrane protein
MNQDTLSLTMFWVGALFAFTPMLVVGVVIGTTWYLRRKRRASDVPSRP